MKKKKQSTKQKTKPILNWLSPKHPFYNTYLPPGLYKKIRDEGLTTDAMGKGHKGGLLAKKIKQLIPIIHRVECGFI